MFCCLTVNGFVWKLHLAATFCISCGLKLCKKLAMLHNKLWPVWLNGRAFARDPKDRGFESRPVRFQVIALGKLLTRGNPHTHVPLSPSSIWYRQLGVDAFRLGR